MFCPKCGTELPKNAQFCSECGNSIKEEKTNESVSTVEESGSTFGWGVLGFFIPLVGLILFLTWKVERPKASKSAGIGALVGFVSGILFYILIFVIAFVFGYRDAITPSIYY